MFIQLENTVEGLVRLVDLSDDYYVFDQDKMVFIGEHTRKIYHIGDVVKVKLEKVSIKDREIEKLTEAALKRPNDYSAWWASGGVVVGVFSYSGSCLEIGGRFKTDNYYDKDREGAVIWSDPDITIDWPGKPGEVFLSDKDKTAPLLSELPDYFIYDESQAFNVRCVDI